MPQPDSDEFPVTTSGLGAFDDPTDTPTLPDPETPVPEPLWPKVSGLYVQRWRGHGPPVVNTLRLDVDRSYRQMAASGYLMLDAWNQVNWIAHVSLVAPGVYTGSIWYVDPAGFFPLRNIRIELTNAPDVYRLATVTFSAPGYQPKTVRYRFESIYFHQVQLEYDWVAGAHPVLSYQTHAHPNRPQGLVGEQLTIDTVFRRAGFDVIRTNRDGTVPITSSGPDLAWSVTELHDAMVTYWSRYSTAPQWALWTLFAGVSDQGLGGIMFDVAAGSPQRRGCAIFTDSFISQPPAGDPAPTAWVERMRFWAACHEMGHAFNLAHSFQKADVPGQFGASWIPLVSTVTSHSFMNYPQYFVGGAAAYFHTFSYRFDDDELLFMRHAPERFVQMGALAFGVNHGFQNVAPSPEPALRMELRVDRAVPTYEFLEPVIVELRLTNVTDEPILVDENILKDTHHLTLLIARRGEAAHVWRPYTAGCFKPTRRVLAPGESMAESFFISADTVGWAITEPGFYTVQAGLPDGEEYVVSNELRIRVAPARGYDDEYFAQDLWADNVARALAFDGSRVMAEANALLHDAVKRFAERRLAVHAAVALAMPMRRDGRVLAFDGDERRFDVVKADTKQAIRLLTGALLKDPTAAAETLGFIDYRYYMGELVALLKDAGQERRATEALATLKKTVGSAPTPGAKR